MDKTTRLCGISRDEHLGGRFPGLLMRLTAIGVSLVGDLWARLTVSNDEDKYMHFTG